MFSSLFGGNQSKAYGQMAEDLGRISPELEKYRQMATGGLQPWQQAGTQALSQYQQALSGMSDPTAYINQIMGSYQESPQAHQQMQSAVEAANAAASASGMLGSGAEQQALAQKAQQLTSADQQQYLQNIMGTQQQYLGGLGGLAGGGQQAATTMGGWDIGTGQNIANIMAQQAAARGQQEMAKGSGLSSLLGGLGTGLGYFFGGPMGGTAMSSLFGGGGSSGGGSGAFNPEAFAKYL